MANVEAGLSGRLESAYSGAVYDALREHGVESAVLPRDIRPLDDAMVLAGPVFTVKGSPKPEITADGSLESWTEFLSAAPADHVVVVEGNTDHLALMGELSAETLKNRGIRGYLSDGGCRDCAFIRVIGFPVFSRFITPRDIVGAWSVDALGAPIKIGGINVAGGDYLVADVDGAVIIPAEIAETIVGHVEDVIGTENRVRTAIRDGMDPKAAYHRYGRF